MKIHIRSLTALTTLLPSRNALTDALAARVQGSRFWRAADAAWVAAGDVLGDDDD